MAEKTINRKRLSGVVVSDKMAKTAVVLIKRYVKHPKYGKYILRSKKQKAHDPENIAKIGDTATIESCRPISKDKTFKLVEVNGKEVSVRV